jgi:hypothetical protein
MKDWREAFRLTGCLVLAMGCGGAGDPAAADDAEGLSESAGVAFITRSGHELYNGAAHFRFAGANIHWLGLEQYASDPWCTGEGCGGVHLPPHAEIDNALDHAQTMGATVVRTMGAMTVGCPECIEPTLGSFGNFDSLDYAIAAAKARHIRLQIPLVDNYRYYLGGKFTYLAWRGITGDSGGSQFFTNTTVIADFERHIKAVLDHVNPYTGLAYKNDATIYAWETGNEVSVSPKPWTHAAWTNRISTTIKVSLRAKQLVVDGHNGVDPASLHLTHVDIFSAHAYHDATSPSAIVADARLAHSAGKAFILGEFTWTGVGIGGVPVDWTLSEMLRAVEEHGINGDMYWELLADGVGSQGGLTLHWPGDNPDMQARARALQAHAFVMCPASGACRR